MEFRIVSMVTSGMNVVLQLEDAEKIPEKMDISAFDKAITKLKGNGKDFDKFFVQQLELMKAVFIEEEKRNSFRPSRHIFEIPIDKQLFKELDLKLDDKVSLEIKKIK